MRTIWKYPAEVEGGRLVISMPREARILTLQWQHGIPTMWALVESDNPLEQRRFAWFATGEDAGDAGQIYIGTSQQLGGKLVFHLFELIG